MQSATLTPYDFPVLLLAAGLVFELVRLRRRAHAQPDRLPLLAWFVRPWTCWAALNVVFRWLHEAAFNNPATFPFFANGWRDGETWGEALARLAALDRPLLWIALAAAVGGCACLVAARCAALPATAPHRRALVVLVALGALLPAALALVPAGPRRMTENLDGPLAPWFETGGTMLHCMPFVKSTDHYLRNFEQIQPRLRISIHGLSHPVLASLSLSWLGKLTGAHGERKSVQEDRARYALALTLFNALGVLAAYVFGWLWSADRRVGLITAALWMAKPAALAHNTFAQDGVYTIFFVLALALAWKMVVDPRPRLWVIGLAGLLFFVISQLSFSWCLVTSIFAAFALLRGLLERWSRRDWLLRLIAPLAVFAALLGLFLYKYRMDYLAIYRTASAFVGGFYNYTYAYQWIMALLGGQLAILIMLGAPTASWFCARVLPGWVRGAKTSPAAQFALVVLAFYLIPVLIGPDCLKMETERCWSWVTVLPLAGVAQAVAARADAPRVLAWLLAAGIVPYPLSRLCICFLS